jgi:hypothetical protein
LGTGSGDGDNHFLFTENTFNVFAFPNSGNLFVEDTDRTSGREVTLLQFFPYPLNIPCSTE